MKTETLRWLLLIFLILICACQNPPADVGGYSNRTEHSTRIEIDPETGGTSTLMWNDGGDRFEPCSLYDERGDR